MARFDRLAAILLVVFAALLSLYAADHEPRLTLARSDFVPFYCAGSVTLARQNSDLTAPLEACERAAASSLAPGLRLPPGSVDPAPLPGYDVVLFSLVSRVPFPLAAWLWELALLAAIVATVFVLGDLTKLPHVVVGAASIGSEVVACFTYGQLAPFAVLALALAAHGVVRDKPRSAGLAALTTLIQPQLGLAVVAALFIWQPRTRGTLALGAGFLAALSFAFLGTARNVAYVQSVLPAQTAAELPFRIQYSLSWLLWALGFPERFAGHLGTADYVLWLVLGVALARRVARRLNAPAALVFFPAAAVASGGPYLHQFQMSAAVPFALVLAGSRALGTHALRRIGWAALALLAVPWQDLDARIGLVLGALAVTVIVAFALNRRPAAARVAVAAASVAALAAFGPALRRLPREGLQPAPRVAPFLARGFDPALASVQHGVRLREEARSTDSAPAVLLGKVPLWLALWGLAGAGLAAGLRPVKPGEDFAGSSGLNEE